MHSYYKNIMAKLKCFYIVPDMKISQNFSVSFDVLHTASKLSQVQFPEKRPPLSLWKRRVMWENGSKTVYTYWAMSHNE